MKAKADCDISKLKEQLLVATEALGERSMESGPSMGLGYGRPPPPRLPSAGRVPLPSWSASVGL